MGRKNERLIVNMDRCRPLLPAWALDHPPQLVSTAVVQSELAAVLIFTMDVRRRVANATLYPPHKDALVVLERRSAGVANVVHE
jgi:hypothetical protein